MALGRPHAGLEAQPAQIGGDIFGRACGSAAQRPGRSISIGYATARTGDPDWRQGRGRCGREPWAELRMPSWGHLLSSQSEIYSAGFVITTSLTHSFCCRGGTALHLCNASARFDMRSASNGLQEGGAYLSRPEECTLLNRNLPKCGDGVGAIDELVGRLVADLVLDRASRRKGGGDHIRLPVMEEPTDKCVRSWPGSVEPKPWCG